MLAVFKYPRLGSSQRQSEHLSSNQMKLEIFNGYHEVLSIARYLSCLQVT
jgi:hypothetical protein